MNQIPILEPEISKEPEPSGEEKFLDKIERFWDGVSAYLSMLIGGLGLAYEAWHRFESLNELKRPVAGEEVLILLVSFLCLGLGVERLLVLRKIRAGVRDAQQERQSIKKMTAVILRNLGSLERNIDTDFKRLLEEEQGLELALTSMSHAEVISGTQRIEVAAKLLIRNTDKDEDVLATGQYHLPESYFKYVAKRVHQAVRDGGDMKYYVILNEEKNKSDGMRSSAFEELGIAEKLVSKFVDRPWPFEALIGSNSVILALPQASKDQSFIVALKIDDKEFVGRARRWFNEVLWLQAKNRPQE